jgi:hypothetical protein
MSGLLCLLQVKGAKIKYLFTFVANNVTMTEEEETEMEDVICPDG